MSFSQSKCRQEWPEIFEKELFFKKGNEPFIIKLFFWLCLACYLIDFLSQQRKIQNLCFQSLKVKSQTSMPTPRLRFTLSSLTMRYYLKASEPAQ